MHITEEFPRSFSIETYGKTVKTPVFVPAISSIKTDWKILEYLDLVKKTGYPELLISAYDIYQLENKEKERLMKSLSDCADKRLIFLDNGNYESYWYREKAWTLNKLKKILDNVNPDFCFSFDVFWNRKRNIEKHIKETVTSIAKTAGTQKTGSIIALIHADSKLFPKVVRKIVDYVNPEIVAIPERELGSGIFERAHTIKKIRDELNKTKRPIPMHILGTGYPVSILIYTLCGADMYDALVWCTNCIEPNTGRVLHFSQRDLIDCRCQACQMKKTPYEIQTMVHNLIFYTNFLDKIRESIADKKIDGLLNSYLRKQDISKIKRIIK